MYLSYCAVFTFLITSITDAFFLHGEKPEPILFCIKVCPLYCSPRRRRDVDASSILWDEPPTISHEDIGEDFQWPHDPYYFCKPHKKTTTTTTTVAPTTEEPTWICMVCMKKCNYPKKT